MSTSDKISIKLPERFVFEYHPEFNVWREKVLSNPAAKYIELDFFRVNCIDSAALGMLVILHRKATASGIKLSIVNASQAIEELLSFASIYEVYECAA